MYNSNSNTQYHTTPRGNFTNKLGTTLSSNDTSRKDPEGRRPIVDSHLHFGQTSLPGMMEEDSEEEDG